MGTRWALEGPAEAGPLPPDGSMPRMSEVPRALCSVLWAGSCRQDGLCPVRRCLCQAGLSCAQGWATAELPWGLSGHWAVQQPLLSDLLCSRPQAYLTSRPGVPDGPVPQGALGSISPALVGAGLECLAFGLCRRGSDGESGVRRKGCGRCAFQFGTVCSVGSLGPPKIPSVPEEPQTLCRYHTHLIQTLAIPSCHQTPRKRSQFQLPYKCLLPFNFSMHWT